MTDEVGIRTALICGKWEMKFYDDLLPEKPGSRPALEEPFLDRIFGSRLEGVSASTMGGYHLLSDSRLPAGMTIVEFFGGAGLQSTMVENLLLPKRHIIIDKDSGCIRHLHRTFGGIPHIQILQSNGKHMMHDLPASADAYLLDYNSWTIRHWPEWQPYWDRLFSTKPLALTFYDTSKPYFHVNKQLYGRILGRTINSLEDYSRALSAFFQERYGYSIAKAVYCPPATYYLLMRGDQELEEIAIPRNSGGFVWL